MEFHFVKLNVNGTYLSLVDPASKPRFICFTEQEKAHECINYVASFRSRYGVWPCFDMSKGQRKLESNTTVKLRTSEAILGSGNLRLQYDRPNCYANKCILLLRSPI